MVDPAQMRTSKPKGVKEVPAETRKSCKKLESVLWERSRQEQGFMLVCTLQMAGAVWREGSTPIQGYSAPSATNFQSPSTYSEGTLPKAQEPVQEGTEEVSFFEM